MLEFLKLQNFGQMDATYLLSSHAPKCYGPWQFNISFLAEWINFQKELEIDSSHFAKLQPRTQRKRRSRTSRAWSIPCRSSGNVITTVRKGKKDPWRRWGERPESFVEGKCHTTPIEGLVKFWASLCLGLIPLEMRIQERDHLGQTVRLHVIPVLWEDPILKPLLLSLPKP